MKAQRVTLPLVCLFAINLPVHAQYRVDAANMYERVMAIVPLIGKGTITDPKRPMYAPAPSSVPPTQRTGILAYSYVLSDDGQFALVQFVARDRASLSTILADTTITSFLMGRDSRAAVQAAFTAIKKDFNFDTFGRVILP